MFAMMTGIKPHSKKSFLSHQINSEIHSSAFAIITVTNNPSLCTQQYEWLRRFVQYQLQNANQVQ